MPFDRPTKTLVLLLSMFPPTLSFDLKIISLILLVIMKFMNRHITYNSKAVTKDISKLN